MKVELKPNEVVVKAGDTNHYINDEKIKGKLILTNQRIYFITVNGHGEDYNLEIMPGEISDVIFFNTYAIFGNGISLVTKDGKMYKFTIKKRDDWCRMITSMN